VVPPQQVCLDSDFPIPGESAKHTPKLVQIAKAGRGMGVGDGNMKFGNRWGRKRGGAKAEKVCPLSEHLGGKKGRGLRAKCLGVWGGKRPTRWGIYSPGPFDEVEIN